MNFRNFLDLAEILAQGSSEAEWRTAISRAYYAAFHVACQRLQELGFTVPRRTEQSHVFTSRRWSNCGVSDINEAGKLLNSLRTDRNQADYDAAAHIAASDAADAVNNAGFAIDVFDEAMKDPERSEVVEGIRAYERDVLKEVTWQG